MEQRVDIQDSIRSPLSLSNHKCSPHVRTVFTSVIQRSAQNAGIFNHVSTALCSREEDLQPWQLSF